MKAPVIASAISRNMRGNTVAFSGVGVSEFPILGRKVVCDQLYRDCMRRCAVMRPVGETFDCSTLCLSKKFECMAPIPSPRPVPTF
jgi:hypothetical protein